MEPTLKYIGKKKGTGKPWLPRKYKIQENKLLLKIVSKWVNLASFLGGDEVDS